MSERFGTVKHLDDLYNFNNEESDLNRIRKTHGGESKNTDWVNSTAKIKLCTVEWDSEFENTIDWTKYSRAQYFKEISGRIYEPTTPWNLKELEETGHIDVNLTLEETLEFNYCVLTLYKQPTAKLEEGIYTFYYFIKTFEKIAPNTTRIYLKSDYWTQYLTEYNITYMMLNRGHEPHYRETTEEFFSDPLNSEVDLTAAEPDLPNLKRVQVYEKYIPVDDKLKAVIVSDCSLALVNIELIGDHFWEDIDFDYKSGDAAYVGRNYTYTPNVQTGYYYSYSSGTGYNSYYDSKKYPIIEHSNDFHNNAQQQIFSYIVEPSDVKISLEWICDNAPYLLKHIKAFYLMPENMIGTDGHDVVLAGDVNARFIEPDTKLNEIYKIKLAPVDFGYKHTDFAKMYTGQFATITITNLAGKSCDLTFEEFSKNVTMYARASTVFPYLRLETFLSGINGENINKYEISTFSKRDVFIPLGKFEDTRVDIDIPIYAVYVTPEAEVSASYAKNIARVEQVSVNRLANDIYNTNRYYNEINDQHVKRDIGIYDAGHDKSMRDRSNAARKTVADNSVTNTKRVTDRTANNTKVTSDRTDNRIFENDNRENERINENEVRTIDTNRDDRIDQVDLQYDRDRQRFDQMQAIEENNFEENQNLAKTNKDLLDEYGRTNGTFAAIDAGLGGGINVGGSANSYNFSAHYEDGQLVSTQEEDVRGGTTVATTTTGIGTSQETTSSTLSYGSTGSSNIIKHVAQAAEAVAYAKRLYSNLLRRAQAQIDANQNKFDFAFPLMRQVFLEKWQMIIDKNTIIRNRDIQKDRDNELARKDQFTENIDATHNSQLSNNADDLATSLANNSDNYSTGMTNNATTYNAEAANTNEEYNSTLTDINQRHNDDGQNDGAYVINAKNTYNSQALSNQVKTRADSRIIKGGIASDLLEPLKENGNFTGDNFNVVENGYCGLSIGIKTISKAEQDLVYNTFNRYGYRMKKGYVVNTENLSLFKKFTYWEAESCFAKIDGNRKATEFMNDIFKKGVTVWASPDVIYDFSDNERN